MTNRASGTDNVLGIYGPETSFARNIKRTSFDD